MSEEIRQAVELLAPARGDGRGPGARRRRHPLGLLRRPQHPPGRERRALPHLRGGENGLSLARGAGGDVGDANVVNVSTAKCEGILRGWHGE